MLLHNLSLLFALLFSRLALLHADDLPARFKKAQQDKEDMDFIITDSVKCYSCLSSFYKGLWPRLSETYTPPLNFSDTCDKDSSQSGIGLVDCPSICIKMWEETIIGGYPVLGFIRGCYDTMLRRGFNQTLVRWYRWLQRDSCHYYTRKDVLQLPFNMPGHIYICTCYSDGCNGSPALSAAGQPASLFSLSLFSALLCCLPSLLS